MLRGIPSVRPGRTSLPPQIHRRRHRARRELARASACVGTREHTGAGGGRRRPRSDRLGRARAAGARLRRSRRLGAAHRGGAPGCAVHHASGRRRVVRRRRRSRPHREGERSGHDARSRRPALADDALSIAPHPRRCVGARLRRPAVAVRPAGARAAVVLRGARSERRFDADARREDTAQRALLLDGGRRGHLAVARLPQRRQPEPPGRACDHRSDGGVARDVTRRVAPFRAQALLPRHVSRTAALADADLRQQQLVLRLRQELRRRRDAARCGVPGRDLGGSRSASVLRHRRGLDAGIVGARRTVDERRSGDLPRHARPRGRHEEARRAARDLDAADRAEQAGGHAAPARRPESRRG